MDCIALLKNIYFKFLLFFAYLHNYLGVKGRKNNFIAIFLNILRCYFCETGFQDQLLQAVPFATIILENELLLARDKKYQ